MVQLVRVLTVRLLLVGSQEKQDAYVHNPIRPVPKDYSTCQLVLNAFLVGETNSILSR